MKENRKDDENPIVIYTSQDGQVHVNVRVEGETAWLTQAAMAQLFGCGSDNIVKHLKNIYDEGELKESARGCRRNGGARLEEYRGRLREEKRKASLEELERDISELESDDSPKGDETPEDKKGR